MPQIALRDLIAYFQLKNELSNSYMFIISSTKILEEIQFSTLKNSVAICDGRNDSIVQVPLIPFPLICTWDPIWRAYVILFFSLQFMWCA